MPNTAATESKPFEPWKAIVRPAFDCGERVRAKHRKSPSKLAKANSQPDRHGCPRGRRH